MSAPVIDLRAEFIAAAGDTTGGQAVALLTMRQRLDRQHARVMADLVRQGVTVDPGKLWDMAAIALTADLHT